MDKQKTDSPLKFIGAFITVLGVMGGFSAAWMETVPYNQKVHNVGLMNDRIVFAIMGGAATVTGSVLLSAGLIMDETKR